MKQIISLLRSWLRPQAPVAPLTADAQPRLSSYALLSRLNEATASVRAHSERLHEDQRASTWRLPEFPAGVAPAKGSGMAMDDAFSGSGDVLSYGIAGGGYAAGFIGYAGLAELAQIPEYRRPCEILANEMTRKWVKITSTSTNDASERIKQLEQACDKFAVQETFRRAFELDNQFGRAHLYIDLGNTDDAAELVTPLNAKLKVAKGSLKALRIVEPMWVYPNKYDSSNPLDPSYYSPQTWLVMSKEIHRTRLLTFVSRPVPDILKPVYAFGGLSLIQMLIPYVQNWLRTRQSVSDITHNFSTNVLKINMSEILSGGGAALLNARAALFNACRDNQGLMALDKDSEDFVNVSAPISGLDRLQAQAQEHMAAPAGVPLVKLFGITPSGLNTSTDGEIQVFYDSIASLQERIGTPNLRFVLDIIQLSEFGDIDPDITATWQPLAEMTEAQLATLRKTEADTDVALINAGVLDPIEVRQRLANAEDSSYSNLNVEDVPAQEGPPDGETDPADEPPDAFDKDAEDA